MPSTERETKFHETLRDLLERSKATVTHKKLASAIGVSSTTVSHYVNGRIKPSFEALTGIAVFFNVTLDYLVFGERPRLEAADSAPTVRAEVQRALTESNSHLNRQRDLVVRLNRRLLEEVDRVAKSLLEEPENVGPAGFFTDSEAMGIESCSRSTRIMIRTKPADLETAPDGSIVPGTYFETMVENLRSGRSYQFLFYGKRSEFAPYAQVYRHLLANENLAAGVVQENLQFRQIDAELPTGIVIHVIDTTLLERREPVLWERYRNDGIHDGVLAYSSVRHLDATGGVVLYDVYFESAIRKFRSDWDQAVKL